MYDIRNSVSGWAQQTFEESLSQLNISATLRTHVYECFNSLDLLNKRVNGYACEKLPKTEEGHTGVKITYSDVFHELFEKKMFSPVAYLVRLVELFIETQNSSAKLNGFLARGIRTLTSFLREPDFADGITEYLKSHDQNVQTNLNSRQDSGDHTDVLLNFKGHIYRIWLFQYSSRGLPHDIDRITGKRGKLPDGTHVLCPLHTEFAIEYDKLLKIKKNIEKKLLKCEADLSSCSDKAISRRNKISQSIQKHEATLKDIDDRVIPFKNTCSEELDILEGWYFYSPTHVKRIADMILSSHQPVVYEEVVKILSAPEQFLSIPKIFIK